MKLNINLRTFEDRYYLILCVLSGSIFFSYSVSSLCAILLVLNSISAPSKKVSTFFKKERVLYFFGMIGLLYSISFFSSSDTSNINLWTQKLLYFLPLLGLGPGYTTLSRTRLNILFKLTILSVLLFFAYSVYFQTSLAIAYSNNTQFIPLLKDILSRIQNARLNTGLVHVAYVSNFAGVLALLVWKKGLFKSIGLKILLSLLFCLFLVLLQARTNIISFILACLLFIPFLLAKEKSYKQAGVKLSLVLIIGAIIFVSIPENIKSRFAQLANYEFEYQNSSESFNSVNTRAALWSIALELINEKPILGQGLGDAQTVYHEKFKEKNFTHGLNKKFNCHNQYLETILSLGLVGLIALIAPLLFLARILFLKRKILELVILLYFIGSIAAESMLERHWGLMFLNFHLLLIVLSYRLHHKEEAIKESEK